MSKAKILRLRPGYAFFDPTTRVSYSGPRFTIQDDDPRLPGQEDKFEPADGTAESEAAGETPAEDASEPPEADAAPARPARARGYKNRMMTTEPGGGKDQTDA